MKDIIVILALATKPVFQCSHFVRRVMMTGPTSMFLSKWFSVRFHSSVSADHRFYPLTVNRDEKPTGRLGLLVNLYFHSFIIRSIRFLLTEFIQWRTTQRTVKI